MVYVVLDWAELQSSLRLALFGKTRAKFQARLHAMSYKMCMREFCITMSEHLLASLWHICATKFPSDTGVAKNTA